MDSTDFILSCWEKEKKVFQNNLSILKKKPEKEAVHDIRVAVKKLRAALELYSMLRQNTIPENPLKETEQLFSILGRQRDIEICMEVMDDLEKKSGRTYTATKNYFRSVLSLAGRWTKKAVREYKKNEPEAIYRILKNETQIHDKEKLKTRIADIINFCLADCKNYFSKPHQLRMMLKKIYYWIKMIPASLYPPFKYEKELHELLDDFGNWQNLTVVEIKLRHLRKDFLPKALPEYESVKILEKTINEEKEKLLQVALNKASQFLHNALNIAIDKEAVSNVKNINTG